MKGEYPALFDLSGKVTLCEQLKKHGINPATVPAFEAAVLNTLQALITAVIELQGAANA